MEYKVLISLGSNKGVREKNIEKAIALIQKDLGEILAISPLYETPSWGYDDDPYLNNVICLVTELLPLEMMDTLLKIELELGRKRTENQNYQARNIDLDIVLIEGVVVDHPKLQVPHPRMNLRKFVLQPLSDIAPDWIHETERISVSDLLLKCEDEADVKYYGKISLHRR
jgi:2-amino-4-hydroxy-6-hydroxymethyldihydropteridine diphosphokinase